MALARPIIMYPAAADIVAAIHYNGFFAWNLIL